MRGIQGASTLVSMRFMALQTDPVWHEVAENRRRIEAALDASGSTDGDYIVLPEMCETAWTTDVAALERALQCRVRSGRVALRLTPDERNGFSLRVVAENETARAEAQRASEDVFPAFARPESIVTATIVRNALGKTPRY